VSSKDLKMTTSSDSTVIVPARVLMALLFLIMGINKVISWGGTAGYFAKLGIPAPEIVLGAVVALEVLGALALIVGWQVKVAALALAAFTIGASLIGHAFWSMEGPQFVGQLTQFLKNLAIVGGLLLLAFSPAAGDRR